MEFVRPRDQVELWEESSRAAAAAAALSSALNLPENVTQNEIAYCGRRTTAALLTKALNLGA